MSVRTIATAVVWLCALSAATASAQEAQKAYERLYGRKVAEVAGTATKTDDLELAKKIISEVERLDDSPELQSLLWRKAYELSENVGGGLGVAETALNALVAASPEKAAEHERKRLELYRRHLRIGLPEDRAAAGKALVQALRRQASESDDAGQYDEALAGYHQAASLAARYAPHAKDDIAENIRRTAARKRRAMKVAALKRRLEENAQDAAAARELAMMLVVDEDDPASAAGYARTAGDEVLSTYIPMAAKPVEKVPERVCLELARWYRRLGDTADRKSKAAMYRRALRYVRRYLDLHDARDAKSLAARRLRETVSEALGKLPGGSDRAIPTWAPGRLTKHRQLECKWGPLYPKFSEDGRYVAAIGHVQANPYHPMLPFCWDLSTGKELLNAEKVFDAVESKVVMVFSPQDDRLAVFKAGSWARWDLARGKVLGIIKCAYPGAGACFSEDGRFVAMGWDKVRLHDGRTGRLLREIKPESQNSLRAAVHGFAPDGAGVVVSLGNQTACWDPKENDFRWKVDAAAGRYRRAGMGPLGKRVAIWAGGVGPVVVNAQTGKEILRMDSTYAQHEAFDVHWSADGRFMLLTHRYTASVVEIPSGKVVFKSEPRKLGHPLGLLRKGRILVSLQDSGVLLTEVPSGKELERFQTGMKIRNGKRYRAAISSDERFLALVTGGGNTLTIFEFGK